MSRLVSWVALAFFVFIVPFISWYYLKQGFNYRRQLLSEVSVKDSIQAELDTSSFLKGKTTVYSTKGFSDNKKLVDGLNEQFDKVKNFQLLTCDSVRGTNILTDVALCAYLEKYSAQKLILIDTAMRIRNFYDIRDEEIKSLVEHITIVLPRKKDSDIEMKR